MTAHALCLNNSGARDRLTLGVYYRVVSERGHYIEVIDDRGERTWFVWPRFTPVAYLTKKEEAKVLNER